MGRIKPGSILVELPLLNYPTLVNLVENLVEKGVKTVDILLESTVIDTELAMSTISVAVAPLSIVIENPDLETIGKACQSDCRFYVVSRDAWAESARVNTETMLSLLRTLASEAGSYDVLEDVRIVLVDGSVCSAPIIVETLATKYPVVAHADYKVSQLPGAVMEVARGVRGVPLAFCISNSARIIALLEVSNSKRTLHVKKPVSNLEYFICIQVLLDFLAYISLKERVHQ